MDGRSIFVAIEADIGRDEEVGTFLRGATGSVVGAAQWRDWYLMRFAAGAYAIFDTCATNATHWQDLLGASGGLILKAFTLFNDGATLHPTDIMVVKPPVPRHTAAFALYVPMEARGGRENEVVAEIIAAGLVADGEPGTVAWYGLRPAVSRFASFALFQREQDRESHLSRSEQTLLAEQMRPLLVVPPTVYRGKVLASRAAP